MNLAKECVNNGVSLDLFLFPNSYVDVATVGLMVTQTGGQIYRYSYFKVAFYGVFVALLLSNQMFFTMLQNIFFVEICCFYIRRLHMANNSLATFAKISAVNLDLMLL